MNTLHRIRTWGDTHHPAWADIFRITLGIFLVYKGISFLVHIDALQNLLESSRSFGSYSAYMISMSIGFIHIAGGILLVLGVLTRFACLIQIPILLGAVFLFNMQKDVFRPHSEIIISIVVLLMLVYFLIAGNGPISLKVEEERRH